jgi:hypothetical protein
MAYYRIYCLDGVSRFITAEEIEPESDNEAMEATPRLQQGLRREVWQRDRHVGNIEIDPSP